MQLSKLEGGQNCSAPVAKQTCKPVRKRCESAARQALEGAQLAPGTLATLAALTNPDRRHSAPEHVPVERFELDKELFLLNLRTARRGAAAGPSGMASDHLFPLLESERDSVMFAEYTVVGSGGCSPSGLENPGFGQVNCVEEARWWSPGNRGRSLVGRTMAKQVTKEVEAATSPFQYALSTRPGCECVTHVLQTLTELDEDATIVSVDGIGAYDVISRKAMLDGLLSVERGEQLLPFVRSFYVAPSTYLWEDEMGPTTEYFREKGVNKVTPSCLYSSVWASTEH